jgi:hypothetical protein
MAGTLGLLGRWGNESVDGGLGPTIGHPPRSDESVESRTLEAHVLAELDVGDPPFADEAADEALSGAQVLGSLVDGEQLRAVDEGCVPAGDRMWRCSPIGRPSHGQMPPASR